MQTFAKTKIAFRVALISGAIFFAGCSVLSPAPTVDVSAIQTGAARSVFATQTADAQSVPAIQTRAAQSIFATQAAIAMQSRQTRTPSPTRTRVPPTWDVTVSRTENTKTLKSSRRVYTANGIYLIVYVTLKNISKRAADVGQVQSFYAFLQDDAGNEYENERATVFSYFADTGRSEMFSPNVPPRLSAETMFVFDLNPDSKGLQLCIETATPYKRSEYECQPIGK